MIEKKTGTEIRKVKFLSSYDKDLVMQIFFSLGMCILVLYFSDCDFLFFLYLLFLSIFLQGLKK